MVSSTIPRLSIYGLASTGQRLVGTSQLTADSQYTIPATDFTPAYPVNLSTADAASVLSNDEYWVRSANGQLQSRSLAQLSNPSGAPLQLNLQSDALPLRRGTVATETPEIPQKYQDSVNRFSITDERMGTLMAQQTFDIPSLNLRVTTDGSGNVQEVRVVNNTRDLQDGLSLTSLPLPNSAEITTGATYAVRPLLGEIGVRGNSPLNTLTNPTGLNPLLDGDLPGKPDAAFFERIGKAVDALGMNNVAIGAARPQGLSENPLLARLMQFQPPSQGLGVSAEMDARTAKQLAASRVGYEVPVTPEISEQLQQLTRMAAERQAQAFNPARMARMMDGLIPPGFFGVQPQGLDPTRNAGLGNVNQQSLSSEMAGDFSRGGKGGGAMPMPTMAGGSGAPSAGFTAQGGENPFMSRQSFGGGTSTGTPQQQGDPRQGRRAYRPLRFLR